MDGSDVYVNQQNQAPKSILILKVDPQSLLGSESFLRSRGWKVYSTVNLTDALKMLFERSIDYFIICANHPNKKLKHLPKLLAQMGNLKLLSFVESTHAISMSKLKDLGIVHQLLPPVSGPAIERAIILLEKDLLSSKKKDDESSSPNPSSAIAGEPEKKGAAQVLRDLSLLMSSDSDDGEDDGAAFVGGDFEIDDSFRMGVNMDGESFPEYQARMERERAANLHKPKPEEEDVRGADFSAVPTEDGLGIVLRRTKMSLKRGVDYAVDESVFQVFDQPVFPEARLGQIDNCLCLSVESGALRGFLVAAMAPNRRFDIPLITRIQKKLMEYLQKDGVAVNSNDEHMEITIRPVHFEAWAVEKAEFLKKSVHQGSEIALAFFPVDRVKPNIGPSKSDDMISVDIDDLVDDTPVNFDVFIHFPVNNKYILYVPKGRTFNTNQKQRLKAKGVTQMHTNKDATSEVNRYHAQNTLNDSIERLEKKANKAK